MSIKSMELKEEELEGNHLIVSCTINRNSPYTIPTHALIDCGATGYAFVDDEFARYHSLPRYQLKTERELEVIDGRPIKSGNITHMTRINLYINGPASPASYGVSLFDPHLPPEIIPLPALKHDVVPCLGLVLLAMSAPWISCLPYPLLP